MSQIDPADALAITRRGDRPRPRDGSSDAEGLILRATEELLDTTPVHELSVAQIIKAAGISRGTFYFYFSSKYAVIAALLAQVMGEIYATVQPFVSRDESVRPGDALRASLVGGAELWGQHRAVLRATSEHWHSVPEIGELWEGVVEQFARGIAAEVDRERAAGIAPPGPDSTQLAKSLLWASEHCFYVAGRGTDPALPDERTAAEVLTAIWIGAIYGGAAVQPSRA
jgi:AcrR family transcriptional regulator